MSIAAREHNLKFACIFLASAFGIGCKEEDVPTYLWNIELHDAVDECNDPGVLYEGRTAFQYAISFVQSDVTVFVEEQPFATGNIAGCTINYESAIWGESRDGYAVRWQLSGEANYRQGGTACELSTGTDWEGSEVFTIVSSEHPDIPAGCTYTLQATGKYVGPAE